MIIDDLGTEKPSIYYRYRKGRELIEKREVFFPYFYSNEVTNKGSAKTIHGTTVFKKYYNKPNLRYYFTKALTDTYEVDVSLENRFLIDNFETLPEYEPRVMHLDIETDMGLDALKADKAITAITISDSYGSKEDHSEYHTYTWREEYKDDLSLDMGWQIYHSYSEKEMLKWFLKDFIAFNPDIITGWNVIGYDIKYIINRMYRLGINAAELSPVRQVESKIDYKTKTPIKGRICFDLMVGYKKLHNGDIGSQALRAVLEDNNAPIRKLYGMDDYEKDFENFLQYSKRDVEGTVWIDQEFSIIDTFLDRQRLAGCTFTDTYYNKDMVDMAHLRKAKEMGFVLPTGHYHKKIPYEGAMIIEPKVGFYKNVIILDYKSLYPASMSAANMSFETKRKDGDIKLGNGVSFVSSPQGLTASLLNDIQDKREYYKKERNKYQEKSTEWNKYDNQQRTTKFLKNSFYGWMGYAGSRIYDIDIASSITWLSREALKHSIEHIKEYYPSFEIIYGHTDSVFIHVPWDDIDYNKLLEIAKDIESSINKSMHELDEKYNLIPGKFKIELEKCMESFLLVGNNRYAGMYPMDDKKGYKIQGFESKKKLTTTIMKTLQEDTIHNILHEEDKEVVFSDVKNIVQGLRTNEFPIEDICIKKKIKKPLKKYKVKSDHIKAAEWSNENLHTSLKVEGDVVNMVVVMMDEAAEQLNVKDDCVVGFETVEQIKDLTIDVDEMIDKLIPGKLENIFNSMGWNLNTLLTSKRIKDADKW